jgi:hypothetical protein
LTHAEQEADKSRELPGFSNFSLPGVRDEVAAMLRLIGHEGIFSTYTRHDISHIDAMLQMLDWLIPEKTQRAMTPVDWLMAVLGIYLHDLGMAVTYREFENRSANDQYTAWRKSLETTTDGLEYLARAHRMTPDEKERFFFQEYVRKGHASRIREWITGRHLRTWSSDVSVIATAVKELLERTPTRFREYLGVVCESHHRADLDKLDRYPIVARLGNHPGEVANVQYAAILLRTADLLHVTQDRTPSREYEAIKFSDPKSVDEWNKQRGTFAVGCKSRRLVLTNPETAVVVINADFTEERPLFALQEYIAYADSEIRQSRRWAEKTQGTEDGKDYYFPWQQVDGDVRLEGVPPQPLKFELDRGRLLDLLVGHTIYNDPTVAIRELLQNSIDAVRFQHFIAKREARTNGRIEPSIGRVAVKWDPSTRILAIEDDGTGMDRDTIEHHLMSVGSSYYNTPQFEADNKEFTPISRFGIGILTCFMVSDDIEIVTARGPKGHRIRMTSVKSTYLLRELDLGDALMQGIEPHGTRVTLRLRDTVVLENRGVEEILQHWIILPECPVEYIEAGRSSKSIGYSSISEALLAGLRGQEPDRKRSKAQEPVSYRTPEVVVKSPEVTSEETGLLRGRLDLAFAVNKGFFPERDFVCDQNTSAAAVCIEGIRVSEKLPGFDAGERSIAALLSVRGSRQFRTTVSRAGLEIDEGYNAAASLCAKLLFEHVADDVRRISSGPGKPLSQASSAEGFLVGQLSRRSNKAARKVIDELNDRQPQIIIEETSDQTTTRRLISPSALRSIREFWTLEARAVDSLGTLSRDLGKELSLNEFLLALAPDLHQLRYTPLLPEAHQHPFELAAAHRPVNVRFSRQHQLTAMRWVGGSGPEDLRLTWPWGGNREYAEAFYDAYRRMPRRTSDLSLSYNFLYYAAPLEGDDANTQAVRNRIGVVFKPSAPLVQTWTTIRDLILLRVKLESPFEELLLIARLAAAFSSGLTGKRNSYEPEQEWRNARNDIRSEIPDCPLPFEIPIRPGDVFDASQYWLDWNRPNEV